MNRRVIEARELSKRYRIRHGRCRQDGLRHVMTDWLARPFRRGGGTEDLWALRDVSFDVQAGEVLGVIGRNGSGKTTLLKVLSRITPPTSGQAKLIGRVGSLLEVGTGFHPDLTGRENIYLNGSILGMRRREIAALFDEIVAFAEIERFLDTPVKRYSSGMYVRLAFAIAAHLQPEILLIDEVLAVGDAAFQKRCLGKMRDVARGGRTVLFVSHNMAAVNALCDRAILLDAGQVAAQGAAADVVNAHLALATQDEQQARRGYVVRQAVLAGQQRDGFELIDIELVNRSQPEVGPRTGDPLSVRLRYRADRAFVSPSLQVLCCDAYGRLVFWLSSGVSPEPIESFYPRGVVELDLPSLPLVAGNYTLTIERVRRGSGVDERLEELVSFYVQGQDVYGGGMALDGKRGLIVVDHAWRHSAEEPGDA